MRRAGRTGTAAAALVAALVLAGCSQVAAIAPVGGNRLAEVRFASIDVLVAAAVDVRTAPACTQAADTTVSCAGDTLTGAAIEVSAPAAEPDRLQVTVGGASVYDGSLQAVLEKAMAGA